MPCLGASIRQLAFLLVLASVWTVGLLSFVNASHAEDLQRMHSRHEELARMHENLQHKVLALEGTEAPPVLEVNRAVEVAPRRLSNKLLVTTNTATSGCLKVQATTTYDFSSSSCSGSYRCPPCFFAAGQSDAAQIIKIAMCGSTRLHTSTATASGDDDVLEFTFVNTDTSSAIKIQAYSDSGATTAAGSAYMLDAGESVTAFCNRKFSSPDHKLYFPGSGSGYCPAGCDALAPTNRASTAFSTVTHVAAATTTELNTIADAGAWTSGIASALFSIGGTTSADTCFTRLCTNVPAAAVAAADWAGVLTWNTAPGSAYCPRGCDAVTPNYGSGNAFAVTKGMTAAVAGFLTDNAPSADVIFNTGATACTSGEQVCMSR